MSENPQRPAEEAAERQRPEEVQGEPLASVLYSQGGDLYQVPAMNKPIWLSVQPYRFLPATDLVTDQIYLGPAVTADGEAWRKAYSTGWKAIQPGAAATLPASDRLVVDYAAAAQRIAMEEGE